MADLDNQYVIKNLDELDLSDNVIWGNKAAYLSDALKKSLPVLDGFCIAVEGKIDENNIVFYEDIKKYYMSLNKRIKNSSLIVRSSAQCEDRKNHIFPGIYRSKGEVSNVDELFEAIQLCYDSFYSEEAKAYIDAANIKEPDQRFFSVLVQEQIRTEYSGVAFTKIPIEGYYGLDSYYVELVEGHCEKMLLGKLKSNSYFIDEGIGRDQIRAIERVANIPEEIEKSILGKLGLIINRLVVLYGKELDIEWGYCEGEIYIFQIRPLQQKHIKKQNEKASSMQTGRKAEAMKRFCALGLFSKKMLIFEPGNTLAELKKLLNEKGLDEELTIRYSYKGELGLPRFFAVDSTAALDFISKTYNPEWTIIIHESICVRDSYELYLDNAKAILEHVPGMWETDNKESADNWLFDKRNVTANAVAYIRKARYEDMLSNEYKYVEPYSELDIKETARKVFPYIDKLKKNWKIEQGAIFHFVADDKGEFFFLNYRKVSHISSCVEEKKDLTIVKNTSDLLKWKGGDILLAINLNRGEEVLLKKYVPFLKKNNVKVYVQFGILSHPAILLREMGIEVLPEYAIHKKYVFKV